MQSEDKKILDWLQEQRLISDFINWAATRSSKPMSRITYYRATIYREPGKRDSELPPRQQFALRLAREFFQELAPEPSAQ